MYKGMSLRLLKRLIKVLKADGKTSEEILAIIEYLCGATDCSKKS